MEGEGPRAKRARGQNLLDDDAFQQALRANIAHIVPPPVAFHGHLIPMELPNEWQLPHEEGLLQQIYAEPLLPPPPMLHDLAHHDHIVFHMQAAHLQQMHQQVAAALEEQHVQEARNYAEALNGVFARQAAAAAAPAEQPAAAPARVAAANDPNLEAEEDDNELLEMHWRAQPIVAAAPNRLAAENAAMRERLQRQGPFVRQLLNNLAAPAEQPAAAPVAAAAANPNPEVEGEGHLQRINRLDAELREHLLQRHNHLAVWHLNEVEDEVEAVWREHVHAGHRAGQEEILGIRPRDDDNNGVGAAVPTESEEAAFEAEREANETDPAIMAKKYARTCPVCYTPNPRIRATIVSCGHLVCRPCAVKVAGMAAPARTFACPVCRKEGSTWIRAWESDDAEQPSTSSPQSSSAQQ